MSPPIHIRERPFLTTCNLAQTTASSPTCLVVKAVWCGSCMRSTWRMAKPASSSNHPAMAIPKKISHSKKNCAANGCASAKPASPNTPGAKRDASSFPCWVVFLCKMAQTVSYSKFWQRASIPFWMPAFHRTATGSPTCKMLNSTSLPVNRYTDLRGC